jgi:hypothetical protein
MIPVSRCRNMKKRYVLYHIPGFKLKYPRSSGNDRVGNLINDEAEFQLTSLERDQQMGLAAKVYADEVYSPFEKYVKED